MNLPLENKIAVVTGGAQGLGQAICGALAMPVATWFITNDLVLGLFTGILGAVTIYRHKSNIQRLLAGTEHKFEKRAS